MPSSDQHPSPEQLVAYHERRLAEAEAEKVRAHLVSCADCTAQLLELADLLDGDGDGVARSEISRAELDAAWQKQRERLPQTASVVSLEERRTAKAPRRWSWMTAASLGLAAALALVVVAQWRTIERLKQPQTNPPLANLMPVGSVRAVRPQASELRFSEGAERAWVILNPSEEPGFFAYRVEIATADGEEVLRVTDLRSSEAGTFRFEVLRGVLKEGDYKVLLLREDGAKPQLIEEFELMVRRQLE